MDVADKKPEDARKRFEALLATEPEERAGAAGLGAAGRRE